MYSVVTKHLLGMPMSVLQAGRPEVCSLSVRTEDMHSNACETGHKLSPSQKNGDTRCGVQKQSSTFPWTHLFRGGVSVSQSSHN